MLPFYACNFHILFDTQYKLSITRSPFPVVAMMRQHIARQRLALGGGMSALNAVEKCLWQPIFPLNTLESVELSIEEK